MMKSTVRFGRVPKREKAKILAAMQSVNARSQEKALEMELEDEAKLMSIVVKAHEDTCDYTKDKIASLVQGARENPVYTQCTPQLACPLNPNPHPLQNGNQRVLEDFSERFSPAIRGVVEFAKRIPGFGLLSQDDQVTLLKAGVFEVLLVRLACMFDSRSNTMICLNGQVLKRESLQHTSNARFLMDSMFDFADRLNMLQLMDSEIGLFCAVVVIAADRPGLRNMELVEKIQGKLMQALQTTVSQGHPQSPCLFQELMKKIPDLRTLNTLHSEKLLAFKMEPNVEAAPHQTSASSAAASTSTNMHAIYQTHVGHWGTCGMMSHPAAAPSEDSKGSWEDQDHIVPSPTQQHHHHLVRGGGAGSGNEMAWSHDGKDHDLYSSPRSSDTGSYIIDDGGSVKSPLGSVSSVKGADSESVCSGEMGHLSELHAAVGCKASRKDLQEGGNSSGDESLAVDSPNGKCPFKVRKLDSPTDSGIESGKEMCCNGSSGSRSTSICSSPRSSMEDKVKDILDCEVGSDKVESIEDMPVLKRALQAPPLINTNLLMDEAYKPHKKFRALRKDSDSTPTSPDVVTQVHSPSLNLTLASTHSTLVKTLEQGPRMSEQQLKRTDIIHDIIMRGDGQVASRQQVDMGSSPQAQQGGYCPAPAAAAVANSAGGLVYTLPQASSTSPPSPYGNVSMVRAASPATAASGGVTKGVVVCSPGYYIPQQSVSPGSTYPASSSWSAFVAGVSPSSPTSSTSSSPGALAAGRVSYVPVLPGASSQQAAGVGSGLSMQLQAHLQLGGAAAMQHHPGNTLSPPLPCHYQSPPQHPQAAASPSNPAAAASSPLPRMYYHPRTLTSSSSATSPSLAITPQSPRSSPPVIQVSKQVTLTSSTLKPTSPLAGQIVEHFNSPGPVAAVASPTNVTNSTLVTNSCLVDNQPLNLSKKLVMSPHAVSHLAGLERTSSASVGHLQRVKLEAV